MGKFYRALRPDDNPSYNGIPSLQLPARLYLSIPFHKREDGMQTVRQHLVSFYKCNCSFLAALFTEPRDHPVGALFSLRIKVF